MKMQAIDSMDFHELDEFCQATWKKGWRIVSVCQGLYGRFIVLTEQS